MTANLEHPREWAQLRTATAFGGLDVLHAHFVTHHYAPHSHPHYAIGLIERGQQQFRYRGSRLRTPTGGLFVVHPDEAHTGEAAHQGGFTYRVFYPTLEIMRLAADAAGWRRDGLPFVQDAVVSDAALGAGLSGLLRLLDSPAGALELESRALAWLDRLVRQCAQHGAEPERSGPEPRAVRLARELLEARFAENVGLLELAAHVGLSPHHFARTFKRSTGLPPHAYLENLRVQRGKQLLRAGVPIAEVALLVGFAHQSHFGNRFRRHVGVPPGRYAQSKIAQDARPAPR